MKRRMAGAALAVAVMGGMAVAQSGERLPTECRRELVQLCRGAADGFRQCALGSASRLSPACAAAVAKRTSSARPMPDGFREERYGADPKQSLAYARPTLNRTVPLLVFVHGGGWSIGDKSMSVGSKARFAFDRGWAFATVNYRLVPDASVEQQAADIASALAWLRAHAVERGFDPDRIVVMGHSAGAHLAALIGTDPRYLAKADVPLSAVKGIVLLDGAGYDVPAQMAAKGSRVSGMYGAAFGTDPARQRMLSPIAHAAAPNVANWLVLPIERRADSRQQSQALADALRRAGASVSLTIVPNESHRTLNTRLGEAGDRGTEELDRFLKSLR